MEKEKKKKKEIHLNTVIPGWSWRGIFAPSPNINTPIWNILHSMIGIYSIDCGFNSSFFGSMFICCSVSLFNMFFFFVLFCFVVLLFCCFVVVFYLHTNLEFSFKSFVFRFFKIMKCSVYKGIHIRYPLFCHVFLFLLQQQL